MDILGRLHSLAEKHAELERQIEAENTALHPDETRLAALKKQKLMMKDQIFALQRQVPPESPEIRA